MTRKEGRYPPFASLTSGRYVRPSLTLILGTVVPRTSGLPALTHESVSVVLVPVELHVLVLAVKVYLCDIGVSVKTHVVP